MSERWPALLDSASAAEYLSVSDSQIKKMMQSGEVKPVLVGNAIRYRRVELDDLIESLPSAELKKHRIARQNRTAAARAARQAKVG